MILERVPMAKIKLARIEIKKGLRAARHLPYCLGFPASFVHVQHLRLNININTKLQSSRNKLFSSI